MKLDATSALLDPSKRSTVAGELAPQRLDFSHGAPFLERNDREQEQTERLPPARLCAIRSPASPAPNRAPDARAESRSRRRAAPELVQLARRGGGDDWIVARNRLVLPDQRSQPISNEHRPQVLARGAEDPLAHS